MSRMALSYDEAVSALYRSPADGFVAERKRLAAELKAGGDKAGAKRLAKLPRPSLSAWAVNQLWWQARDGFEELLATAARLRSGDLGATRAHRDALAALRVRAAAILEAGSHAVTDAVLRRVTTTLSALAANGGFDPDPPGALSADRDPPGFDAVGLAAPAPPPTDDKQDDAEAERLRIEQERERAEQERTRARAERQRLEGELQQAKGESAARLREVERLRTALAAAEHALEEAGSVVAQLEARLANMT
jgi:hypothetical protein